MIRTLPKKLSELGRIRIGDREPNSSGKGTHPHKLDVFRLTSSNGSLLQYAASSYGGEVHPWEGDGAPRDEHSRPTHFELYTTVNAIDVLIPTFSAVSLSYEQWRAGGCEKRCTGEFITHCPLQEALVGTACTCPADDQARAEQAKTGHACARILRLNVLLPDLPGIGVWRLETKGFYGTAELMGTLDMLQMAGQEHNIIEAVLRLEQRTIKKLGTGPGSGTMKFAVPVLWPKYTARQILAGAANVLLAAPLAAEPKALAQNITDLYGGAEEGHTLKDRINALLAEQGLSSQQRESYWAQMAQRYPDLTEPCTLNLLYEHALAAAQRKRAQTIMPATTTRDNAQEGPQQPAGEEDGSREGVNDLMAPETLREPVNGQEDEIDFFGSP
jgi:hypothetical protein